MPVLSSNRILRNSQIFYRKLKYGYLEPKTADLTLKLTNEILREDDIIILQIGANDGKTNDVIYPILQSYKIKKAVLIEPLSAPFEKLKKLHSGRDNIFLENIALSKEQGEKLIYTLSDSNTSRFDSKISSFDKNHLLKFTKYDKLVEENIVTTTVKTKDLMSVVKEYELNNLTLLYIDTEGYDYEILKMIDWKSIHPQLIMYEYCHLSMEDMKASFSLLRDKKYLLY